MTHGHPIRRRHPSHQLAHSNCCIPTGAFYKLLLVNHHLPYPHHLYSPAHHQPIERAATSSNRARRRSRSAAATHLINWRIPTAAFQLAHFTSCCSSTTICPTHTTYIRQLTLSPSNAPRHPPARIRAKTLPAATSAPAAAVLFSDQYRLFSAKSHILCKICAFFPIFCKMPCGCCLFSRQVLFPD